MVEMHQTSFKVCAWTVISRYLAARTMIRFFPSLYVRYVKMTERCATAFPTRLTFPKNSQVSESVTLLARWSDCNGIREK